MLHDTMISASRVFLVIAVVALSVGPSPIRAADDSQLMRASVTSALSFGWEQDGRVLSIQVRNTSEKWLLTELRLTAYFPKVPCPTSQAESDKQRRPKPASLSMWHKCYDPNTEAYEAPVNLLPGKEAVVTVELRSDAKIESLGIAESRGHEPSALERLKGRL